MSQSVQAPPQQRACGGAALGPARARQDCSSGTLTFSCFSNVRLLGNKTGEQEGPQVASARALSPTPHTARREARREGRWAVSSEARWHAHGSNI